MINGRVEIVDVEDHASGLTFRIAEPELFVSLQIVALHNVPSDQARTKAADAAWELLDLMKLDEVRDNGETPFYFWLRSMKVRNRLSFEDGVYSIPDNMAQSIVRLPPLRAFVDLLGPVVT